MPERGSRFIEENLSLTEKSPERREEKQEQPEWQPEEDKDWPEYIQRRFEALNAAYAFDTPKLKGLFKKDSTLIDINLLFDVAKRYRQQREATNGEDQPVFARYLADIITKEIKRTGTGKQIEAAEALGNLGETQVALETLKTFAHDENWITQIKAAEALGNLGETQLALETLKTCVQDGAWTAQKRAAEVLGNLGEPALETLKTLAQDENRDVREKAAQALGNLGEPALETLKTLAHEDDSYVRVEAAEALGNLGETQLALETLKTLVQNEDQGEDKTLRIRAAKALGILGETQLALEILENFTQSKNQSIQAEAVNAQARVQAPPKSEHETLVHSLIVRQEPLLANPLVKDIYDSTKETESPLLELNNIVEKLQKKHPSLVGLSVLGSLSKGYFVPGRDLDWGFVYSDPEAKAQLTEDFEKEAELAGLNLCHDNSLDSSQLKDAEPAKLEIAFNGLFFGDRKQLKEVQTAIMKSTDKAGWQKICKEWEDALENYYKMSERFGLSSEDVEKIKLLRHYLWHLPDYKTAKKQYR